MEGGLHDLTDVTVLRETRQRVNMTWCDAHTQTKSLAGAEMARCAFYWRGVITAVLCIDLVLVCAYARTRCNAAY